MSRYLIGLLLLLQSTKLYSDTFIKTKFEKVVKKSNASCILFLTGFTAKRVNFRTISCIGSKGYSGDISFNYEMKSIVQSRYFLALTHSSKAKVDLNELIPLFPFVSKGEVFSKNKSFIILEN